MQPRTGTARKNDAFHLSAPPRLPMLYPTVCSMSARVGTGQPTLRAPHPCAAQGRILTSLPNANALTIPSLASKFASRGQDDQFVWAGSASRMVSRHLLAALQTNFPEPVRPHPIWQPQSWAKAAGLMQAHG